MLAPAAVLGASGPLGFALVPLGYKSYFILRGAPGRTLRGTLQVVNLTPSAKTILLTAADVSTAASGGLQYGDSAPRGEGRWLQLDTRSVRLSGASSAEVPFTVRVPRGAPAGEHFMGITAVDRRVLHQPPAKTSGLRLHVIPRLAMTVEVQLPGPGSASLTPGRAEISVAPSGASLALGISNPGSKLISATPGNVSISQGATVLFSQAVDLAAFVPRTSITYHVPWEGTPVEGTYTVRGELHPVGAPASTFERVVTFGAGAIRKYRSQTGRAAKESTRTPLELIVLVVVALIAAALSGTAYLRARIRLRDALERSRT